MNGSEADEQPWGTFLVEHYWPGVTAGEFEAAAENVRASAQELTRGGRPVRFLHSTLVPKDEVGLCVLEASSRQLVEETYARAGVTFQRIVESVEVPAAVPPAGPPTVPAAEP